MLKFGSTSHRAFGFLNSAGIGALIAAGVSLATPVHAQDSSAGVEEVVVTGSRVATNGMQAPTPVTTVSTVDLVNAQPKSLIESLTQLPALSASLSPQQQGITTTTTGSGAPGGSYLNLRNLNPVRTLVLVDGQRTVPSTGVGVTDISLFPSALIQRVDIVTGGASAAYGSDAVAGVVNFILDTRFTGLKGDFMGTTSSRADDRGWKGALTYGESEFGGRGHLIVSGEYYNSEGVPNEYGRSWALKSIAPIANPAVTTANPASPTNPSTIVAPNVRSSVAALGGLIQSGPLKGIEFLPGGLQRTFNYGTLVSSTTMSGGDGGDSDWNNSLTAAQRRENLYGRYTYDLNDNLSVFTELMFAHNHEVFTSNVPYETANPFTIFSDNVFLPAATKALMTATGTKSFAMGRIDQDFSPTNSTDGDVNSTTEQATIGANWKMGTWSVDAYAAHGQNQFNNRTLYDQNYLRLYQATDAVANPAVGGVSSVAAGAPICRSTLTNPNNGCVPIDLFGNGSPSAAALAYVVGTASAFQKTQQDDFSITANGKPFSTWAGPVGIGAGFEYRHLYMKQTVDGDSASQFPSTAALAAAGILGVPATLPGAFGTYERSNPQPFGGTLNVKEGFVEALVPLLTDVPFAESLDLNAAARYTDYSFSGGVVTWKVGTVYQPIDELHVRATSSRDIRAPNLYELDTPFSQSNSGSTVTDPSQGGKSVSGINVYAAGNKNLKPEKADTYTAGVVYEPSWVPGLSTSIDYYTIKISGEIVQLGAQQIVTQCFNGVTALCPLIIRTNGNINIINNQYVNVANFDTNGIDAELDYSMPLANLDSDWDGTLRFRSLTNYTGKYLTVQPGSVVNNADDSGNSTPYWQSLLSATYDNGPWTVAVTERLIGAGLYSGADTPTIINVNHVDGAAYTGLTASYRVHSWGGDYEIYGTANNLFDAAPPVRGGYTLTGVASETNKSLFDVIGLDFTLGIRFHY